MTYRSNHLSLVISDEIETFVQLNYNNNLSGGGGEREGEGKSKNISVSNRGRR